MPPINILIVDDDDVDREKVRRLIGRTVLRCEISEANSGRQGLELLREKTFDCLVLDYRLPDTTGIEFLRDIQQSGRPIPIIMITGLGDEGVAVEAMREGAFDYLTKSELDAKKLVSVIEGSLRWARLQEELKKTRERLVDQTRLFQSILDHMSDGIMVADQEGRILVLNPAAKEILGRGALDGGPAQWSEGYDAFLPDRRTRWPTEELPLVRAMNGESVTGVEMYIRRPAGQPGVVIHCRARPLLDENNVIRGGILAFHDVTASHNMARAKDEFMSVISHELRTPLTAIKGSLGLVAAGMMGEVPGDVLRIAKIALSNTDRLVRLINDILDIERLESGQLNLQYVETGAYELMTQAAEEVQPLAARARVDLVVSPVSARLRVDADRVLQVLINLLGNAIKFSPADSTVHIGAQAAPGWITFQVRDHGRGIPAAKLELIFDRFQQVDSSDSREKGGTGLGLAISRTIINQHGGRIWVESPPEGGSTFYFTLPLPQEEAASPPGSGESRPAG